MKLINRVTGPDIKPIKNLTFPSYELVQLENGLNVYFVVGGTQDIFRIQMVFDAGRKYEHKVAVARMTNKIMKEGSHTHNASELDEKWDFYGAIVQSYCELDTAGHSLTGLTNYADALIPTWFDTLTNPTFPSEELEIQKSLSAEKLKLQLSKNDVLAYRYFTEKLYGSEHYYGYNTDPEDYAKINQQDLIDFYNKYYNAESAFAIISGNIGEDLKNQIIIHCQKIKKTNAPLKQKRKIISEKYEPHLKRISTSNDLQCALKLGNITIHRSHEDYPGFAVVVNILGGFFGSRLMTRLREEQGLCYNIYAGIERMMDSSYFFISADINAKNIDEAISEIKNEILILQTEDIDEEELSMVKNYLKGSILASLDGPFRSAEYLKSYLSQKLPFDYFRIFLDELENITSKDVKALANKYLKPEEMTIVIAGA